MTKEKVTKAFKVVSVSSNRNSFGLSGVVLLASDGTAYEVGVSEIRKPDVGQVVRLEIMNSGELNFAAAGFEIPRLLPEPPKEVVKQFFAEVK